MTDEGLELGKLIDSDFLDAIRLLFENQKYVSSIKLLLASVDAFSFIEYGDITGSFKMWISKYCDMKSLGITEDELWEYRNSIVHMTNAYSRKVMNNKVQKLSFYVSKNNVDYLTTDGEAKYFNLISLMNTITNGIENWCESYNTEREKFEMFCERYDLIISDSRYNVIEK